MFFDSLFTLDKNQCRGVDLQQQQISTNLYDEQSGILLKGDNLARMLALRSGTNMSNVERLADDMITYGFIRFGKKNSFFLLIYLIKFYLLDECDQQTDCNCLRKFRNDEHHQYILSNSHRLIPKQRLDLIALMQNNEYGRVSSCNSSVIADEIDYTTKVSISSDGSYKRKKSSSLNSPANSEHRPTADELERRESPWSWRSYSVSFGIRNEDLLEI